MTANLGSTWGQYVQTLDNDAVYLAGIGEPTNDLNQLLSFEIEKANAAYTAQTLVTVTADSLPAPGMDLTFVQSFQQSISGRYTEGILGYGWTDQLGHLRDHHDQRRRGDRRMTAFPNTSACSPTAASRPRPATRARR